MNTEELVLNIVPGTTPLEPKLGSLLIAQVPRYYPEWSLNAAGPRDFSGVQVGVPYMPVSGGG